MTALHAYFSLRQQQSFQRALDGISRGQSQSHPSPSTSGGKSWSKPSPLSSSALIDVNARDWLGRTVLHLACAAVELSSLEYVRLLLAHPAVNVNLPDGESQWTALHRALFHGNIGAAILLLKRSDIDISLKDHEGYTAFDLYNSTISSTKPASWQGHQDSHPAELFTWGANRNAALGHGDSDDKAYADPVVIPPLQNARTQASESNQFKTIKVKQVAMSRLHTVVVTDEPRSNIRVCGFGSGGRLGPTHHTQYNLTPFPPSTLPHTITSVALGQDHTLAVTKANEVLSWGLNRFSQLGYIIEGPMASGEEALIQATPKKVYGALKKLFVVGVAACKTASACYTEDGEVYTWGTNSGQLGYDKSAQPVQVLPRKVTKVAVPVISISITDSVMACLLSSQDVVCIMNDRQFKISFPVHSFPSEMHVYHPPQAIRNTNIAKITSCDETFAALSSNGEVFTFTVPSLSETHTHDSRPISIKPQRVWALRKQFSGVRDVALGADGSLIVATQSGHVFVRSRNPKTSQAGAKTFKFQRIPYLQRVVAVCANSTGAFGALRVDYEVEKPAVEPESAGLGMQNVQSFLRLEERGRETDIILDSPVPTALQDAEDDDVTDVPIQKDISELQAFLRILSLENRALKEQQLQDDAIHLVHGADIVVQSSSGSKFPAHRVWLAARCPILRDVLEGKKVVQDGRLKISMRIPSISESKSHSPMGSLVIDGCSSLSCLILLAYFYTDELTSIWDPRITASLKHLRTIEVKPAQVKLELQALAKVLELPKLAEAVQAPGKRSPMPSIHADLERLSTDTQKHGMTQIMGKGLIPNALCPDVIIQLRDSEFLCHSVVLRARSSLFAAFFDDLDWTDHRRDKHGVIKINLKHWDWRVMQFPLRFLMIGNEQMEDRLNALVSTSDQAIEFLFEIIAAANELLLYRLVLICSNIVLEHLDITNACYMLSDATHYQSKALMHCSQDYLAANMETMLEGRMLDDLTPALVRQLTEFVRQRQAEKFAITRSAWMYDRATRRYGDWLSLQDIPVPIAPSVKLSFSKDPRLSPPGPSRRNRRSSGLTGSPVSPTMRPLAPIHPVHRVPSEGEMFLMDEADRHSPHVIAVYAPEDPTVSNHASTSQELAAATGAVWTRRSSAQKVDMKTIMAEAANTQHSDVKSPPLYRSTVSERLPQRERRKLQTLNPTTVPDDLVLGPPRLSASPWKQNPTPSPVAFSDLALPPASSTPPSTLQTAPTQADRKKRPEAGSTSSLPSTPPRTQSLPGLGPVFSPSRQSPSVKVSPSGSRRVSSSGAAWTLPPVEPVIESSTPLLTSGLSFVAIQQMQLDQGPTAVVDKRSILQIQEEEQALQAEADFMKWWHAEEERVKQEEAQIAAFTRGDVVQGKPPRKPKSAKKNPVAKQRASSSSEFNGGTSGSQPEGAQTGQAPKPQKASKSTRTKLSTGKP